MQRQRAERRASHILLKTDDGRTMEDALRELADIRQRIVDGEDFSELAIEFSEDLGSGSQGGDLGFAGLGTYVPEFETTLFNMEVDELSEPFETEFGAHIILLHEIAEVDYPPIEEREEQIRADLIAELARPAFEDAIAEMDKISWENPNSLDPLTTGLGLEILSQSGVTRSDGEAPFDAYDVRNELLVEDVIENGFNSRPIEVSDSQRLVGRVVSRTAPTLRPLEEVQPRIEGALKSLAARKIAEERRDEAFARLDEDEDFSALANEYNKEWERADSATRENREVPLDIVDAVFAQRMPEDGSRLWFPVDVSPIEFAIVVVSRMIPGDFEAMPTAEQTTLKDQRIDELKRLGVDLYLDSLRSHSNIRYLASRLADTETN